MDSDYPAPDYTVSPSSTSISVNLTPPDGYEISPNSVVGYACAEPSCMPTTPINYENKDFSISDLVPGTSYFVYFTCGYNYGLTSKGVTFTTSTTGITPPPSTSYPPTGISTYNPPTSTSTTFNPIIQDQTLYALFSIFAVIPIAIIFIFAIIVLLLLCIVVQKKKKSSGKKKPTVTPTVLVEEKIELSDVDATLKQNFSKHFILDYNKIVFATQVLGSGAQGTVYKGTYLFMDVAVKLINTQQFGTDNDLTDFYNEAKLLAENSNHPNIVKFIGIAHKPSTHQIALITEYCYMGNLANIVEGTELSWRQKCSILFGIACGMSHLHLNSIIHRDLKAENVLLDGAYCPKIIDFGFSKQIQDMNKTMNMTMNVGTAAYVAPEVIKTMQTPIAPVTPRRKSAAQTANSSSVSNYSPNTSMAASTSAGETTTTTTTGSSSGSDEAPRKKREYDMKVDVYSFAIIMWVVYYASKYPYGHDASDFQIIHSIATNPNFRPTVSDDVPAEEMWFIDLMRECWSTRPEDRPSFEHVATKLKVEIEKIPK